MINGHQMWCENHCLGGLWGGSRDRNPGAPALPLKGCMTLGKSLASLCLSFLACKMRMMIIVSTPQGYCEG